MDYWSNVFSRNSLNNSGLNITGFVHYYANDGNGWPLNAQWDPTSKTMRYGDGNGGTYGPFVALDIVAHEMGHGICQFTANLTYQGESGAINESLSDIWGACVEKWATTNKQTWLCGEDLGTATRSMSNPTDFGQPNTYGTGSNWWNPSDLTWDNGGVHRNSGVMNYWFYLLCQGGSDTNGIGNSYNVIGIGIDKAQRIVYRAETLNLNSSADYNAARNAFIQAAINLYGTNSPEEIAATNAWYAVGVGDVHPPVITGSPYVCPTGGTTYTVYNGVGGTIKWTCSSNVSLVNSSGINATFCGTGNIGSAAWIRADFTGNSVTRNDLFISQTSTPLGVQPNTTVPLNSYINLAPQASGISSYRWNIVDPSGTVSNPYGPTLSMGLSKNGPYTICAYGVGECGEWRSPTFTYVYIAGTPSGPYSVAYPNPANDLLNIEISDEALSTASTQSAIAPAVANISSTFSISLYDGNGIRHRHTTVKKNGKVQFKVKNLKSGTYYLHVTDDSTGKTEKQQIIVKH